jgi:uncharacterized protein YjbI with pentapeptide repeats
MDIEAYVDTNANGKREAWEDPLQGARFRVEQHDPSSSATGGKKIFYVESDATGQAQYDVLVCCFPGPSPDPGTVYAEVPPDYKITTFDRCRPPADCIFGFAALHVTPIGAREADLRGADLRGEDLRDADLTGARLREADVRGAKLGIAELSGADLQEADLTDADLTGANLCEANLRGAKLRSAELSGADLQGAVLSGADLRGAILSKAQMSGAILVEANLISADLSNADLSGAVMSQVHLSKADLHGADLQGVNLSDASLRWANLSAANLSDADLGNANLHEAKYDRDTQWPEDFDPLQQELFWRSEGWGCLLARKYQLAHSEKCSCLVSYSAS